VSQSVGRKALVSGCMPVKGRPLLTRPIRTSRVIDVNLRGTFHLLREAAGRIRGGGSIVTFSSPALHFGGTGSGALGQVTRG
jgi:NAD(P)-dependent dehydrogenase (short-subunit alcohol dehydrogenase family)